MEVQHGVSTLTIMDSGYIFARDFFPLQLKVFYIKLGENFLLNVEKVTLYLSEKDP